MNGVVHNCIPIVRWFFLIRWVCVRCNTLFKTDMSGEGSCPGERSCATLEEEAR